jgi:hypothetical protein
MTESLHFTLFFSALSDARALIRDGLPLKIRCNKAAPSDENASISQECSIQWQEVNSLLEDEIGRMR